MAFLEVMQVTRQHDFGRDGKILSMLSNRPALRSGFMFVIDRLLVL